MALWAFILAMSDAQRYYAGYPRIVNGVVHFTMPSAQSDLSFVHFPFDKAPPSQLAHCSCDYTFATCNVKTLSDKESWTGCHASEMSYDLVASLEAYFVPYVPCLDIAVGRDNAPRNRSRWNVFRSCA